MQTNSRDKIPSTTEAAANVIAGESTFTVHGIPFGSVEAFAQSIKLPPDDHRKAAVAMMNRIDAKAFQKILAAESNGRAPEYIYWRGMQIAYGSPQHSELMSFAARQYQISIGNLPSPKMLVANVVASSSQYGNVSNFALTPFSLGTK